MKASFFFLIVIIIFSSCQKEDTNNLVPQERKTKLFTVTDEMRRNAGDIVYDESNMEHLFEHMDSVTKSDMAVKGYVPTQESTLLAPRKLQTKAYVKDGYYLSRYQGQDLYHMVESEKWVKIKMYNELADAINSEWGKYESGEYQVERGKTYYCTWRYFEYGVDLGVNEYFVDKRSSRCGLKPKGRYQLWNCYRDYESYESIQNPQCYVLLTYILQIVIRDADGQQILFDKFYWPCPKPEGGYVFEWSILVNE